LVVKAGSGETYEPEPALNEFLAQHPNSPVRTFRELADSPVVNARRRRNRREDASIERQKRSQCRNVVADAYFLSCANLRSIDVIEDLERIVAK
jgi:hypothetical protein